MPTEEQFRILFAATTQSEPSDLRKAVWDGDLMRVADKMGQLKSEDPEVQSVLYDAYVRFKCFGGDKWQPIIGLLVQFDAELRECEKAKIGSEGTEAIKRISDEFRVNKNGVKYPRRVRELRGERPDFFEKPPVTRRELQQYFAERLDQRLKGYTKKGVVKRAPCLGLRRRPRSFAIGSFRDLSPSEMASLASDSGAAPSARRVVSTGLERRNIRDLRSPVSAGVTDPAAVDIPMPAVGLAAAAPAVVEVTNAFAELRFSRGDGHSR